MATWDVFRSDRLEVERSLSTEAVRAALARGDLRDDDLIRPAGSTAPWARLAELPALTTPEPAPPPELPLDSEQSFEAIVLDEDDEPAPTPAAFGGSDSADFDLGGADHPVLPTVEATAWDEDELDLERAPFDPLDEDEAAAEFTLSRSGPETVEELDLAAMVDVAFQLVLFFLVTGATVLYKSLEVPRPSPDSPAAAAQGRTRSLDDLQKDFILVEIDASGTVKVDHEPVAGTLDELVARLRAARTQTNRQAMLLSADYATPHRDTVRAIDAANEIGLGIALARPKKGPGAPAPPVPIAGNAGRG